MMTKTASCCDHDAPLKKEKNSAHFNAFLSLWGLSLLSFMLLAMGLLGELLWPISYFGLNFWLLFYLTAYLLVGWSVLEKGWKSILKGEVFTEFFLMGLATLGAFAIGEYPEAVAVMLFYTVGESFQHLAVSKAKSNIQALLDLRPDKAVVHRDGKLISLAPEKVAIGEIIEIKAGERVPLDGVLNRESGYFNSVALTGESIPQHKKAGETVLSGMVNLENLITIQVTKNFRESALSKIIETIQNASSRKAKTEQFIRRFAKVYTPIVTFLAIGLVVVPFFLVPDYIFEDWLYRALVFLVISCPCALVISIPLGYFGGIGAASRAGILFKGSNFLDLITKVNTFIFDKTGTLTKGIFEVQKTFSRPGSNKDWEVMAASLEQKSNHPIARAILNYVLQKTETLYPVDEMTEVAGKGILGRIQGKEILAGNGKLMDAYEIDFEREEAYLTRIHVAIDRSYCGYFTIDDQIKPDAKATIEGLKAMGIKEIFMLSGDSESLVKRVGDQLGLDQAVGGLLPDQKVAFLENLTKDKEKVIAFSGDGINDGPVLALAHVGIAMGGMGSDLAIETADVVIQNDQPSKILTAIKIGKVTKTIVWQNIGMAFGVKFMVLALGAAGIAGMWEAVFADVGVALLAILNAIRINKIFNVNA